jgi:hypothetical protein
MRRLRVLMACAGAALLALLPAGTADAFWSARGAGNGRATTGTLAAPAVTGLLSAPGQASVLISWSAGSGSPTPTGYYLSRTNTGTGRAAPACGTSAAQPVKGTSCLDGKVPNGQYTYTVVALYRSWTATSAPSPPVTVR